MLRLFVFLLFLITAALGRYWYVCEIKQLCNEDVKPERPKTLSVKDDDVIIMEGFEQFLFEKREVRPILSDDNRLFIDSLAHYLEKDTNKVLTLAGVYLAQEIDSTHVIEGSFQENLGLARAEALRSLIAARGIEEERIYLEANLRKDSSLPEEPISFSISTRAKDVDEYSDLNYTFENMTYSDANFKYNSDLFQPGKQFLAYADSVKRYLEINPDKMLFIIGHTDSIGGDTYNEDLGLRRAKNTAIFFQDSLKVDNLVQVETKGRTDPVAPNNSEENRQKNRRVNIRIK